jgi:FemAB-related protein (PEP-CTERM system-associated)
MEVSLLVDESAAWDEYVMRHPLASNYHQSAWKAIIEQGSGHTTRYLLARQEDQIQGVLPLAVMKSLLFGRFLVSLPFVNYGGILTDNEQATEALLTSAQAIGKEENAAYLELRHRTPYGFGLRAKHHKVTMILALESDVEIQWKAFDPKLRNQIRKATKAGLQMQVGGEDILDSFYAVFARNMRDLGTPVYGLSFFKAIITNLPSSTRIFVIRLGEKPVAAGLASIFKDTVEMPWAGSLREHRSLCGNMLLYWAAIKFSIEQGFRKFDFGRSTPGEGTYKFKEQWGAQPVTLVWEYWTEAKGLPNMSPQNPKYALAIRMWKRLPVALTNRLGPAIVRNIP